MRLDHRLLQIVSILTLACGLAAGPARADNAGQIAFNNACRTCHSVKEGDNRLGPSLYGIVGKKAGTVSGYQGSAAMQNSGIVWDRETLDNFIANPDSVVYGNAMKPFGGIGSAEERKKIVDYLVSISSN